MEILDSMSKITTKEDFTTSSPENKAEATTTATYTDNAQLESQLLSEAESNEMYGNYDPNVSQPFYHPYNPEDNPANFAAPTPPSTSQPPVSQATPTAENEQERFRKFDEIRKRPYKKNPTEFIAGRFPRKHVTVIAGAPDVGKSLTLEKLYADLSKGGEIFGGMAYEEKPLKSIVITGELPIESILERNEDFDFGIDFNYVEIIDVRNMAEENINIDIDLSKTGNSQSVSGREYIEHLAQSNPDVMIFDSLGALYHGKENDNQGLIETFTWLYGLAKKYNIAVLVVHHIRKRLFNERKKPLELEDIIGGSAITRYCAAAFALEFDDKYGMNIIRKLKHWYKPNLKPIGYKRDKDLYDHSQLNIILDPEKNTPATAKTETQNKPFDWKKLLNVFLQGRGQKGATLTEINAFLSSTDENVNEGTLRKELTRCEKAGKIVRISRGIYALPENELIQISDDGNQIEIEEKTDS